MRTKVLSLRDILSRNFEVVRQGWNDRRELEPSLRLAQEAEFLPAHLEVAETPVHPAPLWAVRTIAALIVSAAAVALFGHLDVVSVARGKLVPTARVKIIQPAITGVVRDISVQNGDHVTAGQRLLELDPTQAVADTDKAHALKMEAQLAAARAQSLLEAAASDKPPFVTSVPGVPNERRTQVQTFAEGLYREYRSRLASLRAQLSQREAELVTVQDEITRLRVLAPMARKRASGYKSLADQNYMSKDTYLEKEQDALKEEGDLQSASDRATAITAAVDEQRQEIATVISSFRREQLEDLEKAQEAAAQSADDQVKAQARERLTTLTAPVSGTVENLAIHTIGGVVTTAEPLLEIVPNDTLEVEANIDNKDIGFVEVGQDVVVKIDAFPYSRFGFIRGKVASIADDATQSRTQGLQYIARVALSTNQILAGRKRLNLTTGMQVVAEIRTGQRSVAEFLLSPFTETVGESMRER